MFFETKFIFKLNYSDFICKIVSNIKNTTEVSIKKQRSSINNIKQ